MAIFVWGAARQYAFLKGSPVIAEADRESLLDAVVEMLYGDVSELDVEGQTYEGRLFNTGKYGLIGEFGGYQFEAELKTEKGDVCLRFLIREEGRMEVSTDKIVEA